MSDPVQILLEMSDEEAEALAELAKRFGHDDAERFGNRFDGGRETAAILRGVDQLRRALEKAGFAPR